MNELLNNFWRKSELKQRCCARLSCLLMAARVLEFAVLSAKASSFKWTLRGKLPVLLCAVDEQICKTADGVGCMWMLLWIFAVV